tara:strand:- start:112 stop:270 length:159 start_codon:yes stop_codon:yes gene_type:complete
MGMPLKINSQQSHTLITPTEDWQRRKNKPPYYSVRSIQFAARLPTRQAQSIS